MPAWVAGGREQAEDGDRGVAGQEILTLGYGSGDAAEGIPFVSAEGWRQATAKIGFGKAMESAIDLEESQYIAMHDGRRATNLDYLPQQEFVIDKVGQSDERQFQDIGIEYYRYVG